VYEFINQEDGMSFLFGKPSAQQEEQAGIALTALFAGLGKLDGTLTAAKNRGAIAHVIEIAPEDLVGSIGKTSAFTAFRQQVRTARPDVVDVRPVTVQHLETFGFSQNAGAALYLQEPTPLNRAKVWLFDLMN
jgi:hypothetical protein